MSAIGDVYDEDGDPRVELDPRLTELRKVAQEAAIEAERFGLLAELDDLAAEWVAYRLLEVLGLLRSPGGGS